MDTEDEKDMVVTEKLSNKLANMGFVCVLMVVFIHFGFGSYQHGTAAWWVTHVFRQAVAEIAVPFFFLKAGFLLAKHCDEDGWWFKAVKKRVVTLLVPFAFWACLMFSLCHLVLPILGLGSGKRLTINATLVELGLLPPAYPNPVVLWFLRSLFIFVLISPVVVWGMKKLGKWLLVLMIITYLFGDSLGLDVLQQIGIPIVSFCFFSAGIFLYRYPIKVRWAKSKWLGVTGLLLGCMMVVFEEEGYGDCAYWLRYFVIPCVMIGVWNFLTSEKWPDWLLGNTFAIFILHIYFARVLDHFPFRNVLPTTLCAVVYWTVALVGSFCFQKTVRYVSPGFAKLIFGGR